MALGAQNQQLSLQLILSAQDEASAKIKAVGDELQKLGKGVSLTGLSEGIGTSLQQVTTAIKDASRQQEETARTSARAQLDDLRSSLREREQAIKRNLAAETQDYQNRAQQQLNARRDLGAQTLRQERSERDEMLRDARSYFDQLTTASRAAAEKSALVWREAEREQIADARSALQQRLAALTREQEQELERIKMTARQRAEATRQLAEFQALPEPVRKAMGLQPSTIGVPLEQIKADEAAQTAAIEQGIAKRRDLARTDAATTIRDARRQRQDVVAEEKAQGAEELALLQANRDAALETVRTLYQRRVDAVEAGLRRELESIKTLTSAQNTTLRKAADEAIAAARMEADGMEQAIATGLNRALADIQANTQQQVAAQRTAGERILAESQRLAQEQARVAKAGGPLGVVLDEAQGHLKRFGGAVDTMSGAITKSFGPLEKFVSFAKMMVVWQLGYTALSAVLSGLGRLATGLITTNTSFEQTTKTFQAFYGKDAPAVVAWLDRFAETTPATREEVRQAGLTVAALGDNMGKAMPALENLASVMGKDLPTAAQAFSDAQQGRFEMMQISMRTTKTELLNYGLQVDGVGHIMNNSFVPAFERYVQTRFGEHVAYDAQQVAKASATLAGAGAPTTGKASVMPALEYGASMMGIKSLSTATDAYAQAMQNNLKPLESMFSITTAELVKQGLVIGTNGQIVAGTLAPAFAKVIALDFGGHIGKATAESSAMAKQMETLEGAFSNLSDVMTTLQRVMGQGIFDVLKKSLIGTLNTLQDPVWLSWAHKTGEDLGKMAQQAADWFHKLWVQVGGIPGVMRLMGQAVQTAQSVFKGLSDTFHGVWNVLGFLVGTIRTAIGLFTNVTGIGRGTNDMTRTMVAFVGDAYIAWKVLTGGLGFAEGALKLWNSTAGKANKALIDQKIATDAQKAAQLEATRATQLGADAETTLGTNTKTTTEIQVAAKTTEGELKTATEGLTLATGDTTKAEEALALATGAQGAAGAMGVAETITGRLGGAISGLKGVLLATLGPIGLWVIALGAAAFALKGLWDAWDTLQNKMDPAARKDIASALTPTGAVGGQPIYAMHTVGYGKSGAIQERVNTGTTKPSGDIGAFGHSLWTGGAETEAYWAYARMIQTGNPDYWVAYLSRHSDVEKRYLAMMDKEGRGDVARQILSGTSPLLQGGSGAPPSSMDAYNAAFQGFQWDLAKNREGQMNDAQRALADLSAAQSALEQAELDAGKGVAKARTDAQNFYIKNVALIPKSVLDQGGYALPASTQGDQTVPGETPKQYGADLRHFKDTRWRDALNAVRAGKISDTDLEALVQEYETLQTESGGTVTDTKIRDQIKTALKTRVSHMLAKFTADLKLVPLGKITQQALEGEISQMQTVEAQAGMTDYTDYEGKITTAFAKKATTAAKNQMTPLVNRLKRVFDQLKHHMPGITAGMVENLITQIQGIETGAGISTDDMVMFSQKLQDWLGAQQTASGKTQAISTYQQYKGEYDTQKARFEAEKKAEPDVARGMISGLQEDIVQMAYARTKNWSYAIAEGQAAVLRLNAEIFRATGSIAGLSDAEALYKDDLVSLGQSAADRKKLTDDANAVYKLEIAGGMNRHKAHKEYEDHLRQINRHMKAAGVSGVGAATPYPSFAPRIQGTSYGQTIATFGGTQRDPLLDVVAQLRAQNHKLQQQVDSQARMIALLEIGNSTGNTMVGILRNIAIPPPVTSSSGQSATAMLKGRGTQLPVTR